MNLVLVPKTYEYIPFDLIQVLEIPPSSFILITV